MFCEKCGNNNDDNARFCAVCGNVMEPQAPVQQAAPDYSYNAQNYGYGAPYNSIQPQTAKRTVTKPTLIFMIISMVSTFLAAVLPLIPLYKSADFDYSTYTKGDSKYYNIITNFTHFFTKEYEHSQSFYSSVLQFVFLIMAFCLVVAGIILFFLKFKASPAVFLAASVIMVGEIYAYFFSWWSELLFMADRGSTGYEATMTIVPLFAMFLAIIGVASSALALAKFRRK